MEILCFKIRGKIAHFRKYYANNTAFSFSIPPRTSLMGIVAAAMGWPRDSYYEDLASEKIRFGVRVLTALKKSFHRLNFLSIKSTGDLAKKWSSDFRGERGRIQTPFEIVSARDISKGDVIYQVFISPTDAGIDTFKSIKDQFLWDQPVHNITLGTANFTASIFDIELIPADKVIEKSSDELVLMNTAVPSIQVEVLEFKKEKFGNYNFVEEDMMPGDFVANGNREVRKMNNLLFSITQNPIRIKLNKNFFEVKLKEETINLQFMDVCITFFSHSKISPEGRRYGSKELIFHINGVLEKAQMHYATGLDLGIPNDDLKKLLKVIVQYHDLGKYTSYFQNYLLDKSPMDGLLRQHARIGGFTAYNILREVDEKKALIALYIIFLHHSYLIDIQRISEKLNDNLKYIIDSQKKDLLKIMDKIQGDLNLKEPERFIYYPEEKPIRRAFKLWALRNPCIQDYFLINYLFSLLTEADKLDASDTIPYTLKKIDVNAVDQRFGETDGTITRSALSDVQKFSNGELRNFCRAQVLQNLENPAILDQYIFTLTAPTGIGKTMTALDFALKLKEKMWQELKIESRIIYALPFINIIEQALKEYKETLPKETEILAHYQYADLFGKQEKSNEDGSEPNYNQRIMALDTWQADVIITSFVQFFETLIGNRNKLLKKFNHYANAVIILDEVQTLRLDQMPLIGAILFYLSRF